MQFSRFQARHFVPYPAPTRTAIIEQWIREGLGRAKAQRGGAVAVCARPAGMRRLLAVSLLVFAALAGAQPHITLDEFCATPLPGGVRMPLEDVVLEIDGSSYPPCVAHIYRSA